jgi:serine/threonine protein kinase
MSEAPTPQAPRAAKDPDRLIGTLVADKYRVLALIARGGMGRIYRAEQLPLGRVIALKILTPKGNSDTLDPQMQKRFLLEAATCAKLTHPNTVTVFDYGHTKIDSEDVFYIVMEYVEGRTMQAAIREDGRFAPARALRVGREICRSLKEAHKLGIVHRDLKPSNVMLLHRDDGESVKVLDFGIAKVMQSEAVRENLTLEGNFVGSPRYMAPEQIRQADVDTRADIYALGVVMYEAIAGVVPFDYDVPVKTLMAHLQEPPPPFFARCGIDIHPAVSDVVFRCLEKDPKDRYPDVDAVRKALRDTLVIIGDATGEHSDEMRGMPARASRGDEASGSGPQAMVIDGSAPTIERETPRSSMSPVLVAVVAMLLLLGFVGVVVVGIVVFGIGSSGETSEAPPVADAAPPPAPLPPPPASNPTEVWVTIASSPAGAQIWEGTRLHGVTPLAVAIPPSTAHTYTLKLDGYEPFDASPTPSTTDQQITAVLTPAAKVAPPTPPPKTPPKTPPKKPPPTPPTPGDDEFRSSR